MATRVKSSQILDGTIVGSDLHSAVVVNTTAAGTFASLTANGGLTVDNFTLDGTTLALSSGNLVIDSASDMHLDVGGQVKLDKNGVLYGNLFNSSNDLGIHVAQADQRLVVSGSDNGTPVNALILDMANGGRATFSENIVVTGNVGTVDVVASGNISAVDTTLTGTLKGPATFTIDPAVHGANSGTVVIAGDLQVDGTTTTINSTTMDVDDLNITVAKGAANAAAANGAGLTVDGASATLLYASTGDKFIFNKPLDVTGNIDATGNILVSGTVDGIDIAARDAVLTSTTTTAGAALPKAGGTMTGDLQLYKATPIITLKRSDNTTLPGLSWQGAGGVEAASIKMDGTSGATNTLVMSTHNGSTMAERLRLMTSAAGGITVTGTIVATGNILPSEDVRILDGKAARFGTGNDFSIYNDGSDTTLRNSTSNQDIIFLVNDDGAANTEAMRIDASTNRVGIGTDAPDSQLHVHGVGAILSSDSYFVAQIQTDRNNDGSNDDGILQFVNGSAKTVKGEIRWDESTNTFELGHGDNQGHLVIASGGNVGIGTDAPVQTLDVDGSIGTRQVRHSVRPSLNLDFGNSKELDSRITFYRDSIATYYDSKGTLKYANVNEPRFDHDPLTGESKGLLIEEDRTNIFTYTNNPERWPLVSGGSSDPIVNNIKSPDGTFNATSLIIDGSDPYFYQNNLTLSGTYTFSYWIKAVGTAIGKQYTTRITNVSTNSTTAGTLPSEWTRYTFTFTTGSTTTAYIGIEAPDASPADGDEISIWGAQLELGGFATSIIPSDTRFTSRASDATYYDETGVLRTAPVNGARHGYKYDGRKWVETGLILEAAATNRKQNFISNAGALQWSTNQNSEPVANYTVKSPDDSYTTIRQKINSTANAIHSIYDHTSVTATSQLCFSVYAKAAEYNRIYMYTDGTAPTIGGVTYDLLNGTIAGTDGLSRDAYGIEDVGNGWYRCWYSGTTTSGTTAYWHIDLAQSNSTRSFVGTVGQGLYLWGPQMEYSGALSSYIYTDTSAVTRSADVASSVAYTREQDTARIHDISWYNSKESTMYGEGTSITGDANVGSSPCLWGITDGTSSNRYLLRRYTTGGSTSSNRSGYTFRVVTPGFNNDYFPLYSVLPLWQDTEIHKMALSIKPNSQIGAADGIDAQMTSIAMPEMDGVTMAEIGFAGSSTFWNGHIRKLSYYPAQLSLTELQALTENN